MVHRTMKIALCGIAGSGKDFLGKILIEEFNLRRLAFGDEVKTTCHELYPYLKKDYVPIEKEQPLDLWYDEKHITATPREIWMDTARTIRKHNDLYFFKKTLSKINEMCDNIVVTDLRTEIEMTELKKLGFTIIHVEPLTKIYEPNDFDKQIDGFKNKIPHHFINDFDGTLKFKEFMRTI